LNFDRLFFFTKSFIASIKNFLNVLIKLIHDDADKVDLVYFVVDPIAPILMLLNLTVASGCWDSTSEGTPEVVGQGPRAMPGLLASPLAG
jgi:hypothetical protein